MRICRSSSGYVDVLRHKENLLKSLVKLFWLVHCSTQPTNMLSALRSAGVLRQLGRRVNVAGLRAMSTVEPADEIAELIHRSRVAQAYIEKYSQEQVDDLITAMVYAVSKDDVADKIAQHAVDETHLGNYNGKYLKIHRKTRATLLDIIDDKSVGIIEEDKEREIVKVCWVYWLLALLVPARHVPVVSHADCQTYRCDWCPFTINQP